jgi:hypothetical protein
MRLLGTSTAWWIARSDAIAQEIRKREQGATAALWPLDGCSPSKYPQGDTCRGTSAWPVYHAQLLRAWGAAPEARAPLLPR